MNIEITILISIISVSFAVFFGISTRNRNNRNDIGKQVAEQTAICTKLEFISENIKDVKTELNELKLELSKQNERLIRLEESDKAQWIQINKFNAKHYE